MPAPEASRVAWASRSLKKLVRHAAPGSDALLTVLADQLTDAVFIVDKEQNILLFNRRAEEITGFSRADVIGRHCLTGIRCARCLSSCGVFAKGQVKDVPLDLARRDGGGAHILKTASVVRDRKGEVIGAIEIFRLAPEEQRECVEGAPNEEAEPVLDRMGTMLGALGRGVIVVDEDFVIRHVSAELARITGHEAGALAGTATSTLLGDDISRVDGPFRTALARGERREGWRATLRHADGTALGASVSGAPLRGDPLCDGEVGEATRHLLVVRPDGNLPGEAAAAGQLTFEGMVARSQGMRQIFQLIELLADSDATVLITGESGTGKELVARAIHAVSGRADHPFVAVNCGALPGELLESELFGHARGAFTGAVRDKPGRFEVVGDGTILLDEIGDLPLPLQVKLLRVLQERAFERVGETTSREMKARIVAATHQDLPRLVAERAFREDLFYRLNVVPIQLPPLRERREDIEPLIFHLLERIGQRRVRAYRLSPGVLRTLLAAEWPGNVRQLENVLEYATTVCEGETIHEHDLPPEISGEPASRPALLATRSTVPTLPGHREGRGAIEPAASAGRGYPSALDIEEALRRSRYRKADAAKLLGVSRTTLWRRMRALGMD